MASLNKVLLMGNLTRDPELRYTPGSNAAVCEFGIAINRRFIQNGQERDETCFVDIVVWGKQAESCSRYLQKGANVFVEGRLTFEQWVEKESQKKRSRLRVTADRVQFLNGRREDGGMEGQPQQGDPTAGGYQNSRGQYQGQSQGQRQDAPYRRQQYDSAPGQYNGGGNAPRYPQAQQPSPYGGAPAHQEEPPMPPEADPMEDVDDIPF